LVQLDVVIYLFIRTNDDVLLRQGMSRPRSYSFSGRAPSLPYDVQLSRLQPQATGMFRLNYCMIQLNVNIEINWSVIRQNKRLLNQTE
jgi:hypothetical protein